jgi:hypothetical protein
MDPDMDYKKHWMTFNAEPAIAPTIAMSPQPNSFTIRFEPSAVKTMTFRCRRCKEEYDYEVPRGETVPPGETSMYLAAQRIAFQHTEKKKFCGLRAFDLVALEFDRP